MKVEPRVCIFINGVRWAVSPEIVGERALVRVGQAAGFDGHDAGVAQALDLAADVGHGEAGKVGAAAGAADDHVGIVAGKGHLLDGFLPDDGLVEQDVVEHAAQAYLVSGSLAATSTASEMAMPREPLVSGCSARMARPDSVSMLGLAVTDAPKASMRARR